VDGCRKPQALAHHLKRAVASVGATSSAASAPHFSPDSHRHGSAVTAEDLERVIVAYRSALQKLDDRGEDQGSIDYLATTLREMEKFDWMLRAHLGK
jgi:DNA-binding ferritin-like protein